MSKQIKDALRLLVLTIVAGAALGVVYNVTKEPVAEAAQKKEQAAYKSVVPVVNVTSHDGYNGDISYSVGIDAEGKINKVEFLSISETPGLGMQAKTKPEHLEQYVGIASDNFTVVKDGSGNLKKDVADKTENIDSLSGSTITSKSVNNGINAAVVTAKTVYSTPGLKTVGGVPIG